MYKQETIDKYAARLLMVSFFLPMHWQVYAVFASCIYFVVRVVIMHVHVPRSNYVWALVLGSGYLLYLFSFFLTPEPFRKDLSGLCEHKVSFLLMPFAFAVIAPAFGMLIRRELMWFVYACFITCLAGNMMTINELHHIHHGFSGFFHVEYRETLEHITHIHPTYMSMYLCFSICVLLLRPPVPSAIHSIIRYCLLYASVIFLLALLAKSPLIALLIIIVHVAYLNRKDLYKYRIAAVVTLLIIICAWLFIPFIGQRINEGFQFLGHDKKGNVADNSVYVRQLILSIDASMLKDYWLTGIGPGRLFHALREHYFFYSLGSGNVVPFYDPHNEYLWEWLSFGIIGLVVYAGTFIIYLVRSVRTKDYLFLYLLLILYITFFTESVLSTQRGILFYAIFTSLFFYRHNNSGKHATTDL